MIVRRFLAWARIAPACARADATSALARAFLFTSMEASERYEAEIALTVMLDDPSPLVHRALAEAIANATEAPRHLIAGLVTLGGETAALILGRTKLLSEAELVDAAAIGGEKSQVAIAEREPLPATVGAALAEVGSLAACIALIGNPSAAVGEFAFLRMLERFGDYPALREALLRRAELPARVRERLVAMVADALKGFVVERGWLTPGRAEILARDAAERGALVIAADADLDPADVIACLRDQGRLTPAFIVQALLSGETRVVTAALADLGKTPPTKVAAFLREEKPAPLAALLKRAGVPAWLIPLFPVALAELRLAAIAGADATASTPRRLALRRIIARMEQTASEGSLRIAAYLHGFEVEAARGEARALAQAMIALDEDETVTRQRRALARELSLNEPFAFIDLEAEPVAVDLDAIAVARAA